MGAGAQSSDCIYLGTQGQRQGESSDPHLRSHPACEVRVLKAAPRWVSVVSVVSVKVSVTVSSARILLFFCCQEFMLTRIQVVVGSLPGCV
jgi:hypothetical protein